MKFSKKGIEVEMDRSVRDFIFKKSFIPEMQKNRIVHYVICQNIEDPLVEIILPRLGAQIVKQKYLIQIADENIRICEK